MKRYIAIAVAGSALLGAALPATASARVPMYAGGAPIIGCQDSHMGGGEWLWPIVEPTSCTVLYRHATYGPVPVSDEDRLHGLRWSHWGQRTATGIGWISDHGGPYRVTVRAWRPKIIRGMPAPYADIPVCRDNIRYYSRVTIREQGTATWAASTWTDSALSPTLQC
jgi:hypothetical protein